jgi:hypothetical protein
MSLKWFDRKAQKVPICICQGTFYEFQLIQASPHRCVSSSTSGGFGIFFSRLDGHLDIRNWTAYKAEVVKGPARNVLMLISSKRKPGASDGRAGEKTTLGRGETLKESDQNVGERSQVEERNTNDNLQSKNRAEVTTRTQDSGILNSWFLSTSRQPFAPRRTVSPSGRLLIRGADNRIIT